MQKALILYNGDDDSETELPFKWVICSCCDGNGTSSAYLGAFTSQELEDEGQEFVEDYFEGRYDRACDECGGAGKVKVVDAERTPKDQLEAYREQERGEAEDRATNRMERLMEGGWREEGWYGRG